MAFAIIAEFPLGTYRGHRPDGSLDDLPSPARLHAALLNAAAQGPRADDVDGSLTPNESDRAALAWAETNPPDALHVPASLRNDSKAVAFRKEGLWFKWSERISQGEADGSVAIDGPIAWLWNDPPSPVVQEALIGLCSDVSHLGTGESPVILRVGEIEPTHRRDPDASPFIGGGIDVGIACPGRTETLEAAYRAITQSQPTPAADAVKTDEAALAPRVESAKLGTARYVANSVNAAREGSFPPPWETAVVLPIDEMVPPSFRVSWAVALHRALIGLIGDGAPSLVTGRYAAGVDRPANRLAIQYISHPLPLGFDLERAAFVLLLPSEVDRRDYQALAEGLRSLSHLRITRDRIVRVRTDSAQVVHADEFWAPVPAGQRRVWVTEPLAIPESHPVRGQAWSLEDAALLSVALLWRDALGGRGRGRTWYARLAAEARAHGVQVLQTHRLQTQGQNRFVHRVQDGVVLQPYRATLTLGDLSGEQTVIAIGQSRHLGGGLLVPCDLPPTESDGAS
jgi:CRISPR-associated protein Csb2